MFPAIEAFVIRFDSVSKKLFFCYYNSMNKYDSHVCLSQQYIQDQLNPTRDDVDEKYLGSDGMLTKYDNYRYVLAAVAATGFTKIILVLFFIYLCVSGPSKESTLCQLLEILLQIFRRTLLTLSAISRMK